MNFFSRRLFLMSLAILMLALSLSLTACSDSDDPVDPGSGQTPAGDTTAPLLLTSRPNPELTELDPGQTISAFFSEVLDPSSLDGNITMSTGTISDLVLVDGSIVQISHDDWNAGEQVLVTFATGLADTSGNHLAEEVTFRYWVESDVVRVLETTPADGSTDVLCNAPVPIKFSHQMLASSLETGITATIPGKGDLDFTISRMQNNVYQVIFDDTLPEDTHVMFTVGTTCETWNGEFLAEEYSFSFDTGVDLDETSPEIVSFVPASGSEISTASNTLQITFNEPVGPENFDIIGSDLLTLLAIELSGSFGIWNADQTVITFVFKAPIAAGVEMTLNFGDFQDLQGNVNSSRPTWNVTVAGTPDHFPVDERIVHIFSLFENDGHGNFIKDGEYRHNLWMDSSRFRHRTFDFDLSVWNEWDNIVRTNNGIEWDGFRELVGGVGEDVLFDHTVKILNHPTVTASWDGSVEVSTPGGTLDVVYDLEVLPDVSDYPAILGGKGDFMANFQFAGSAAKPGLELFWPNCRSVVQHLEASMEGELSFTETDTLIYCPGFGLIMEMTHHVEADGGDETHSHGRVVGLDLYVED